MIEMPPGYHRLYSKENIYDSELKMIGDPEVLKALKILKEMAEALKEIEEWAPKDLYAEPPWKEPLKKFKEWK